MIAPRTGTPRFQLCGHTHIMGRDMRIVYLAGTQIPSRATNGIQVMRMCAAFASKGADVTLVHPRRFGNRPEGFKGNLWSFYGVTESFRIVTLPTPLSLRLAEFKRFARVARGIPLAGWVIGRSRPGARPFVVYSRSMLGAWLAIQARRLWGTRTACRGVYVEMHDAPPTERDRKMLAQTDGVVAISAALRDHLVAEVPSLAGRLSVQHDGVNENLVWRPTLRVESVRRRLGIEPGATVVGYSGRINAAKGLDTVLRAAELLRTSPVHFLLVGKVYGDVDAAAARSAGNVTLTGFVPPVDVPSYLAAADILVMPSSAKLPYARFTSPLKLFEYFAAERPVICSDLPVLREIVQHERNALLFTADDARSLAASVERLRTDQSLRDTLAQQGRRDVMRFTWESRAEEILETIAERCGRDEDVGAS